jgi:hypothetical protein
MAAGVAAQPDGVRATFGARRNPNVVVAEIARQHRMPWDESGYVTSVTNKSERVADRSAAQFQDG